MNLLKAIQQIGKDIKALHASSGGGTTTRKVVYVTKAELFAMNGNPAGFGNNIGYVCNFPQPLPKKPMILVQLDFSGMRLQYIYNVTNTGFMFASNYGADILGLWYEIIG